MNATKEDFDKVMDIDWGGVYNCTRAFLPLMLAAPAAHVVNTASICGFFAQIGYLRPNVAYSTAKFAVRGFTLALLADFKLNAPHIKASCVMPGWIGTNLLNSAQAMNLTGAGLQFARENNKRLRARVAQLRAQNDPTTLQLEKEGLLDSLNMDMSKVSDQEMQASPGMWRQNALTSAAQAAQIILDGVRKDEWRILVGEDAVNADRLIREDEKSLYDDETIIPDFFSFATWKMNRAKSSRL